jgi:hypothetical protein
MIIILILIAVYIVSAIILYRWTYKAYSEEGIYSLLNTEFLDIFLMFCPFANTICAIFSFFDSPYKEKEYKAPKNYNKFFGIKK